jgi:predicted nicotinamide N-methyase
MTEDEHTLSPEEVDLVLAGHNLLRTPHRSKTTAWCDACDRAGVHPLISDDIDIAADPDFIEYADRVLEEMVPKMAGSAVCISLVPDKGALDVKFAVELGYAILMDKPIIAVAASGAPVPDGLRRVAQAVVEGDIESPEGQERLQRAISAEVVRLHLETD